MPFPSTKRVIYRQNPLQQVICQLRFPPILRIDAEIPVTFQEKIRSSFPNFKETSEIAVPFPEGLEVLPEAFRSLIPTSGTKNYEFSSEDNHWKINLTRTFLSLSTTKYERWEKFSDKLREPWDVLVSEYSPSYFSRVGLRYVDVIRRSTLGLENVPWEQLLQPHILGVVASPNVGESVLQYEGKYEIRLGDEKSLVRMITKLTNERPTDEPCFVIDSDFFSTEKTAIPNTMEKLDLFHTRASRLIQWAILPQLHQAMEPQEI